MWTVFLVVKDVRLANAYQMTNHFNCSNKFITNIYEVDDSDEIDNPD